MARIGRICVFIALVVHASSIFASQPLVGSPVKIEGDVYQAADISAVVAVGRFLVIASDERSSIQVLQELERGRSYRTAGPVNLADPELVDRAGKEKVELDLEGIAADQQTIYVIGSHSRKRSRVKQTDDGRTYAKNRKRMTQTHVEYARNWLFRTSLGADGRIEQQATQRITLRNEILINPVLQAFWTIPGKENGINIEGLAMRDEILYAGLRSPVLRGNWVPVLLFKFFKRDAQPETITRFVHLDGLGVRGMETVEEGFLLMAGPAGDASGEFRLYLWNGEDMLPGSSGPDARLTCIAQIQPVSESKPESMALLETSESAWEVLIAFDGVDDQNQILRRFEFPRKPDPAACH